MNGVTRYFRYPWRKFIDFRCSFNGDLVEFKIIDMADDQLRNGFFGSVMYITPERRLSDAMDFVEIADVLRNGV